MLKSKAHFRVIYGNDSSGGRTHTYVPVSYFTIEQSRDSDLSQSAGIHMALTRHFGRPLTDAEYPVVLTAKVFDAHGRELPPGVFTVIEYSSFFAVRLNATGEEVPMGDGVDSLIVEDEDETVTLSPGTIGFVETWTETLNESADETMAAYFPDNEDVI
jgi:hypothetical protein